MDVDNLMIGKRFDVELARALGVSGALIALIGPRWSQLLQDRSGAERRTRLRARGNLRRADTRHRRDTGAGRQ
jgi:hypothetical protein